MKMDVYYVQVKACKLSGDGITPILPETIGEKTWVFCKHEDFNNFVKEILFVFNEKGKENKAINI